MCSGGPPHVPGHCPAPKPLLLTDEQIREIVAEGNIAAGLDPFCPMHGRKSRPIEVPGLRCDCEKETR